jgi:2'-5' RNA ligase
MPEADVYDRLRSIIAQLSKPYATPDFEPHVTLIGQLTAPEDKLIAKTSQIAKIIKPYTIRLTTIDYLDEYFKCLFIRVEQTNEVMHAYKRAYEALSQISNQDYIPHLSLMYGNIDMNIKDAIIKTIGKNYNMSFPVYDLYLYSTGGEPKTWYRIAQFPLRGQV